MKKKITLNALGIDPAVYFTGTDKAIKKAERKEAARKKELEKIIFSGDFEQITYKTEAGAIRSLHRSTRPGVLFQLSYIDPDGVPTMHENFIRTAPEAVQEAIHGKQALIDHFIRRTLKKPLYMELTTA